MEQILQLGLLVLLILVALLLLISGVSSIIYQYKSRKANKKLNNLLEELCTDIIEEIVKEAEEKSKEETQPAVDYNSMTINELKDIAKSRNIKGYYRMKKDELVKVLNK